MYPEHPASSRDLWLWLLVTWFKWIAEPLGHIIGQEVAASFTSLFLFYLFMVLWVIKGWMALRPPRGTEVGQWISDKACRDKCKGCPGEHPRGKPSLSYPPVYGDSVSPSHSELLETCIHHLPARIPSEVTYLQLHMTFWATSMGFHRLWNFCITLHYYLEIILPSWMITSCKPCECYLTYILWNKSRVKMWVCSGWYLGNSD